MKVLYIEDDREIASLVQAYLVSKGDDVSLVQSFKEAAYFLLTEQTDLCLLDWNLPEKSGLELCRWITMQQLGIPVLFLTVKEDKEEILNAFAAGADDFITKPFDLDILYSRMQAIIRRQRPQRILRCQHIAVDQDQMCVQMDGKAVDLTRNEYLVLLKLIQNKGKTLTRQILVEEIWEETDSLVQDNTLSVTMKRLRKKLNNPSCIKTVRSFGYRMEES